MTSRRCFVLVGAAAALSAGCTSSGVGRPMLPGIVDVPAAMPLDWESAPPASQRMDAVALAAVLQSGADVAGLRSLLVVRNGMLVGERYYAGASAPQLLRINSVTKSVSSMLVGQALQRGTLPGLSTPLSLLLPQAFAQVPGSAAAQITLEQILTGRSGLSYDWTTQTGALMSAADPVHFALSLPVDATAPLRWSYNDAAVGLIAAILARAEGMDLAALAARDLFTPLGIQHYSWQRDRLGNPIAFGGLALRTRDLVKLAWTMLDGGRWQGAAVLPAAWVADSTQPRGPASWQISPIGNIGYGCLWFTGTLHGKAVVWGWGYGGQFALLVPELRLAVATAATSPRIAELRDQTNAIMGLVAQVVQSAA